MYGDCLRMKRSQGDTASDYNETTTMDNTASLSGKATVLANSTITTANMTEAATSPEQKITAGPVRSMGVRGKPLAPQPPPHYHHHLLLWHPHPRLRMPENSS